MKPSNEKCRFCHPGINFLLPLNSMLFPIFEYETYTEPRVTFMQKRKKHFLIKYMNLSENAGHTWSVEEI